MGDFEEELRRQREAKQAADDAAARSQQAEEQRRAEIRRSGAQRATSLLPEVEAAVRALQAAASKADRNPYGQFPLKVNTKVGALKRTKVTGWDVGSIHVPRSGRPRATRPGSSRYSKAKPLTLQSFAAEGHWWWTTHDSSSGRTDHHEADAGAVFDSAIKAIAQYLASLG